MIPTTSAKENPRKTSPPKINKHNTAMKVNPILDELGSHGVAAVQQRARDLRASGRPIIDFSIGDPREPTPRMIPEALISAVPEVSQYPTTKGLPALLLPVIVWRWGWRRLLDCKA